MGATDPRCVWAEHRVTACDHEPTPTISNSTRLRFLRPLRLLRLNPPDWSENRWIQRTGANRHANWRCGRCGCLPPVANLQRSAKT